MSTAIDSVGPAFDGGADILGYTCTSAAPSFQTFSSFLQDGICDQQEAVTG
jgi:hypothetical protein